MPWKTIIFCERFETRQIYINGTLESAKSVAMLDLRCASNYVRRSPSPPSNPSLITSPHGDNFFLSPTILCFKDPRWPKKYRSKGGQVLSSWFSPDVITAMLVHGTKEKKKVFWNLTISLCKTRAIICYCFVRKHGRLIT